jgi:hypothetical protein
MAAASIAGTRQSFKTQTVTFRDFPHCGEASEDAEEALEVEIRAVVLA